MLCLIELWFDCVSFGVYFEYAKMKYKTKSMHVLRACRDFRTRRNLEEDGRDNTPAPTK